jgi:thiol-disulfide isomerase/thioredoxin
MKDASPSGRRLLFRLAGTALLKAAIEGPADAAASEAPPLFGFEGQFIQFVPPPTLPILVLETAKGSTFQLSPSDRTWRLLNIWATWCLPCLTELPKLERLLARSSPRTVEVVSLCIDDASPQQVEALAKQLELTHVILCLDREERVVAFENNSDSEHALLPIYGLSTTYLINPDNAVLGYITGSVDWDGRQAEAWIVFYLESTKL